VMYAGRVVERGPVEAIFNTPQHPYTEALLHSIPVLGMTQAEPLKVIRGMVPSPLNLPSGCRFRDRCPRAAELCADQEPELQDKEPGHPAACHFPHLESRERPRMEN